MTAITGGGWVLCEVKALSHGTKGQSNGYHQFGYYRRDRIRRLVGLYGCAVEGWEGGCACGVGSDLTACDYVAVASRRNTGRILTERYRGFRATCNSPSPAPPGLADHPHTIDRCDDATGENLIEQIASVGDYLVALETYRAAVKRWPGAKITLRNRARVIEQSWED